jgi:hypothetical protein
MSRETCAPVLTLPPSLGHGGDRAPDVRRMRQRGQRADLGDAIDADLTSNWAILNGRVRGA